MAGWTMQTSLLFAPFLFLPCNMHTRFNFPFLGKKRERQEHLCHLTSMSAPYSSC
jgi:hypothetical protein